MSMVQVPRAELLAWAKAWESAYGPGDDTDCVTPFDKYLYGPSGKPPSATYDRRRIAWELERTAMGDGYYGNALYVAKELPEATPIVRSLLDRWATGKQGGLSDRTDLCAFALKIYAEACPHPTEALAQQPTAENDDAEQLAACREDWQRVCKAISPDGMHLNPDEVVEWIEKQRAELAEAHAERLSADVEAWKASHALMTDACHYFQARAERLAESLKDLEVCANTIDGCFTRNPGNFAVALRELRDSAERSRDALHPNAPEANE